MISAEDVSKQRNAYAWAGAISEQLPSPLMLLPMIVYVVSRPPLSCLILMGAEATIKQNCSLRRAFATLFASYDCLESPLVDETPHLMLSINYVSTTHSKDHDIYAKRRYIYRK